MRPGRAPFEAHIELLHFFVTNRSAIVESIQGLLNAQRKPIEYLRDPSRLSRHFESCFFTSPGVTDNQTQLQGQLEAAYWAAGFKPRRIPGLYNGLVDPAEMMVRAFHLWHETRWPGRSGRVHYAHTLFNLYVLRCLVMLSPRLWDDGSISAGDRLSHLQAVLDRLWEGTPANQPVLARDARWLIPLAQSPATDDLGAYFDVAQKIAETLSDEDRIEIHKAGVRMTGGHLRSQLRYHSTKQEVDLDEDGLILSTRNTNALDFALLIQELVPLLEAYEQAVQSGNERTRLELADAICQGISPDPELFLNRVELLSAYSMLEHLFIATDSEASVVHTPMGRRHVQLVEKYEALIGRVASPLCEDCQTFRPLIGTYSPYGVLYGFTINLVEHMAFKTLQPDEVSPFSLEDVFTAGDSSKLAWVTGWRKLPHLKPEVTKLFEYPQQFAERAFERVRHALTTRVPDDEGHAIARAGRLFVRHADNPDSESETCLIPDLPAQYIRSSDGQLVAAGKADAYGETDLLADRREGKFVVSYATAGGWVAITKAMLTDVLGAGRDVKIAGVPFSAAQALTLLCPGLAVLGGTQAPTP